MKLNMSSIKFDADQTLLDFVQRKADKLDTYFENIIDGEVNLSLDNNKSGGNKIVEMKLFVPGQTLFAKEKSESFEAAADLAVEALRRQLRKFKGKLIEKRV